VPAHPNSHLNKVAETRNRLLALVESCEIGSMLPPERDLATELGVARMTVRRAMDDLVTAGLVKREQGRGTFVMRPKVAKQMAMTSFSDGMRERGLTPGSDVTGFRRLRATAVQARALRIPAGEAVYRFTRLRSADGEPVGLETTWVAAAHVPGLERSDLHGSWYELLDERYGIQVLTGTSIVEIGYAAERDARLLGCEVGAALLRIETTSYGPNGRIVDFGIDLFRGDRYSLVTYRMPNLGFRGAPDRQHVISAAPTPA
jgi:DNA-binding GntR family transcriptional regulator